MGGRPLCLDSNSGIHIWELLFFALVIVKSNLKQTHTPRLPLCCGLVAKAALPIAGGGDKTGV